MTHPLSRRPRFLDAWGMALLLVVAPAASAQQAVLIPTENVRIEYGQVLRAEPIYEIRRETWLERQCPDGRNRLPRFSSAVRQTFVAIRYSQVRSAAWPLNDSRLFHARRNVSCVMSWASS